MGDLIGVTPGGSGTLNGNPFEDAATHAGTTQDYVLSELDNTRTVATGALDTASATITALQGVSLQIPDNPVQLPDVDFDIELNYDIPPVNVSDFGEISAYTIGPAPNVGNLPSIDDVIIPPFIPSVGGITLPTPPIERQIATPGDPPSSPVLQFPNAPVISYPDEPLLDEVSLPAFTAPVLPTFDPEFPEFQDSVINTVLDWNEPQYDEQVIRGVINKINEMLAGGLAIDPAVEQGIVDRGRDREDRLVRQAVVQAMEEFANRGYSSPPGLLVERIDQIREEGTLKKLGLNREVVLKIFDEELANMRLAVQQGIVAEELFVRLHLAATERLFEVLRLDLDAQLRLYDLQVTVFNAKMREVEIRAQVYETQVRGKLAEIEAFKALVDAELAKAEVNKAKVDAYRAQIEARETFVRVYEAQVRAVAVRAEVFANEINAFRGRVEAYAAEINAEKLRFDAYEAQIRGELGKATIVEAEARAYTAEIEGVRAGVQAQVERVRGETNKIQAQINAYVARTQGTEAKARTELAQIQANVAGYQADTQRFVAESGVQESANRVNLAAWEAQNRLDLAFYDAQIAKFRVDLEGLIQQARLALDALRATGDISSTISAGALAAMHLGATVSGGAQISASGTNSIGYQEQVSDSRSKACNTQTSVSYTNPVVDPGISCPF